MLSLRFFSTKCPSSFFATLLNTPKIAEDLSAIYTHPFNKQLFAGTLNPKNFGQYLRDDDYYLHHYARILNILSQRLSFQDIAIAKKLCFLSEKMIAGEQEMQAQYIQHLANKSYHIPGKAISSYVRFLTFQAEKELPIALSSVLPCFWIYSQLGVRLKSDNPFNPYQGWIDTYSSKEFVEATDQIKELLNQLAEQASVQVQLKMQKAFATAVRHELKFFDAVKEKSTPKILYRL